MTGKSFVKALHIWVQRVFSSAFTKDLPVIKIRVAHHFSVLCSPIMYRYVLGFVF
jgi:hypothetical protein